MNIRKFRVSVRSYGDEKFGLKEKEGVGKRLERRSAQAIAWTDGRP